MLAPGALLLFTVRDTVERSPFTATLAESPAELVPNDPPDFVARVPHGDAIPA